ncbi:MAG: response regulator [Cyanobacteria bacterium P01_A01_bin.84]
MLEEYSSLNSKFNQIPKLTSEIIFAIDDSPANLEYLRISLSNEGYEVLTEKEASLGFEKIKNYQPDLVLLDVMMPKMDGFEICKQLKTDISTKDIPVIFMTALSDTEEKVRGLSLGAVDYITKPFQLLEILARIQVQLKLRKLNVELAQQKQQLEERVRERTSELFSALEELKQTQLQLIQSEKASSLGQIVAGISHEVNNPVGLISTNLYYANQYAQDLIKLMRMYQFQFPNIDSDTEKQVKEMDLEHVLQDLPKLLSSMKLGTDNIRSIMQSLQNFSRSDGTEKKSIDIHEGLETTLMILQYRLKSQAKRPPITIIKEYGNLPKVDCYPGQINQVFMNLLVFIIEHLEYSYNKSINSTANPLVKEQETNLKIVINTNVDKEKVIINIADNGDQISEEFEDNFFQSFIPSNYKDKQNILGISISNQIITDNHDGNLEYYFNTDKGAEFFIHIPL